jgi:Immunoglobulin-like domain of bacterial spore germination
MHKILLALVVVGALAACSPPQGAKQDTPAQAAPSEATIAVTAPRPGDHIKSPFVATGTAPNNWFFEASFPTMLVGADSRVIAEAPAQAQTDWMTPGPVGFRAELTFHVDHETPATLVLQEDMPGEEEDHPTGQREIRIPVMLEPN